MFVDPHEIANVLGLPGVRLMHDEAVALPGSTSSCRCPPACRARPGLEHAGAALGAAEVARGDDLAAHRRPRRGHEFPRRRRERHDDDGRDRRHACGPGSTVGGHYASPDLGLPFHGYVAGGPADDHEGTRVEDAIARVRQGMRAMLRLGSAWYDVASQIKAVTERGLDPRSFILCTDDCHAGTLVHEGHMDRVVRHAIAQGLKPVTAIQMATLNTACHFGLERELGSIAPGRIARPDPHLRPADPADRDGDRAGPGRGRAAAALSSISTPTPIRPRPAAPSVSVGRSWPTISRSRHPPAPTQGPGAGDRRDREPGADAGARGRSRRGRTAACSPMPPRTSARSPWSSGIAAPAASPTPSCPGLRLPGALRRRQHGRP